MVIFSARLKWTRNEKGLTQAQMAKMLGMSQPGYTKIENGQREPNLETLAKFPDILEQSVDFLIGVTDFDRVSQAKYNHLQDCLKTVNDSTELIIKLTADLAEYTIEEQNRHIRPTIDINRQFISMNKRIAREDRDFILLHLQKIPLIKQDTINKIKDLDL